MNTNTWRPLLILLLAAVTLLGLGCASEEAPSDEQASAAIVPPGKADNYFSDVAQEYTVTGRTWAQLDDACLTRHADDKDPQQACQREAIGLKNFSIAWFFNQYIVDKHDAANEEWGGFTAMTRPQSFEALETEAPDENGRFAYTFTSELSGPLDFLKEIPTEACEDDRESRCFTLEVPVLANSTLSRMDTGSEWYRRSPYNAYAPDLYDGEKETLSLKVKSYPRSNDAFLEYGKLFSKEQLEKTNGQLRVGVFVGWDYYEDRYDLQTAKEVYRWLTEDQDFESPSKSYDEYTMESGDFTKTIKVRGEPLEVSVRLVHPGQGNPSDPVFAGEMKANLIQAFSDRQIIIYEGHAGPLYGFALGDWNTTEAGELDDSELPSLEIPQDFYQVVLASGCDTYMVADSLYENTVKANRVDLDVITTTSFSNAAGKGRTAKALMRAVFNQDDRETGLKPWTYGRLLRELNREYWMTPLYGVHGIDDNPRTNPFANEAVLCQPCESADDCGGDDNMCVLINNDQAVCTVLCQSDEDCPNGYSCWDVATDVTIVSKQCAPSDLVCE